MTINRYEKNMCMKVRRIVPRVVVLLCLTSFVVSAQDAGGGSDPGDHPWLVVNPISSVSVRMYRLDTHYPALTFRLVNSDGETVERGWTPFGTIRGGLDLFSRFSLSYDVQASGTEDLRLKKGSMKLSDFGISLELARGSVWMGNGVHGSLLLSNHAEPFTLLKFATEEPFSIPYIGEFDYMMFHGWPQRFKILGQRLSWRPVSWLELGGNQTVVYTRNYRWWELFRILSASEANVSSIYNTDQRASMDFALRLPFITELLPSIDEIKLYGEYAGEDLFAVWQQEDDVWYGPFGFDFLDIGTMVGVYVRFGPNEVTFEYSQNYRNKNLFHDFYGELGGYGNHTMKWYGGPGGRWNPGFTNGGAIMGHHMGNQSDDLYVEWKHSWNFLRGRLFHDRERRALVNDTVFPWVENKFPEITSQFGVEIEALHGAFDLSMLLQWNRYENVSVSDNILEARPIPGRIANERLFGLTITYSLDEAMRWIK